MLLQISSPRKVRKSRSTYSADFAKSDDQLVLAELEQNFQELSFLRNPSPESAMSLSGLFRKPSKGTETFEMFGTTKQSNSMNQEQAIRIQQLDKMTGPK